MDIDNTIIYECIDNADSRFGGCNLFCKNSILLNSYGICTTNNSILINFNKRESTYILTNCNTTLSSISQNDINCINDEITGQTFVDYFNKYDANDWLQCDFTAKEGSKNIGAGEKGTTIGLNQGYTMYADNSSNDMFKASNGAVLKNVEWNNTLQGYTIVQKEKICQGATSNTITLDSSASSVDDYYNNLFVGIVGEDGFINS